MNKTVAPYPLGGGAAQKLCHPVDRGVVSAHRCLEIAVLARNLEPLLQLPLRHRLPHGMRDRGAGSLRVLGQAVGPLVIGYVLQSSELRLEHGGLVSKCYHLFPALLSRAVRIVVQRALLGPWL